MKHLVGVLGLICALALSGAGSAQAQQMRFWSSPSGNFDYYVLALSWSPSYCEQEGKTKGSPQCAAGRRIGFTVHGLWPQYGKGYPSDCSVTDRTPPRYVLDGVRDLFPDEGLARYQWRKHGSCTGGDPAKYFQATREAFNKVRIPPQFKSLAQPLSVQAIDIERAFAAANPGLRSDMMRVMCRRGQLQEVRVCFDRNLRGFMSCANVERGNCGFMDVRVSPAR